MNAILKNTRLLKKILVQFLILFCLLLVAQQHAQAIIPTQLDKDETSIADEDVIDVAMDSDGNVYVLGRFDNTISYPAPDDLAQNILVTSVASGKDLFLAKFNDVGNIQWVSQAGGDGDLTATRLIIDHATDLLYVSGYAIAASTTATFDQATLAEGGFLASANADGVWQWVRELGIDVDGNINVPMAMGDDGALYLTSQLTGSNTINGINTTDGTDNAASDLLLGAVDLTFAINRMAVPATDTVYVLGTVANAAGASFCNTTFVDAEAYG
ncbi:MAG: hypothetical protein KAU21_14810, partial [Gammaproteobacteria bacterium]|nr:hypothetical protein [Gammaproteobacteria bacterium]